MHTLCTLQAQHVSPYLSHRVHLVHQAPLAPHARLQTLVFAKAGWNVIAIEAMARNRHVLRVSLCLHSTWNERVSVVATALGGPQSSGPCVVVSSKANNLGNGEVSSGLLHNTAAHFTHRRIRSALRVDDVIRRGRHTD